MILGWTKGSRSLNGWVWGGGTFREVVSRFIAEIKSLLFTDLEVDLGR